MKGKDRREREHDSKYVNCVSNVWLICMAYEVTGETGSGGERGISWPS